MKSPDQIIKALRLTEKSNRLSSENNQYTFEVFDDADRVSIARAVAKVFKVDVTKVNILRAKPKKARNMRTGRPGQKSAFKKAIVTLKEGDKIEIA